MAGDLELAPEQSKITSEDNSDLGKVMAEGVPDGTMQRSPPGGLKMKVAHSPAFKGPQGQRGSFSLRNINQTREVPGSGNESSPASIEAINRGTRNIVHFNGDSATPVLGDVTQIDRITPPKGSIAINADTGKLVSSGNAPRNLVEGLLARWRNRPPDLGDSF
jgi:hypothetical protein